MMHLKKMLHNIEKGKNYWDKLKALRWEEEV